MPNPNGPPGSWTLVFEDDFTGTSLNTTYWNTNTTYQNNVDTVTSNIIVDNGLTLVLANSGSGAEISSNPAYYLPVGGVAEAYIYFPGDGAPTAGTTPYNWPAWWAWGPASWPADGEIDIAEGLGTVTVNYHGPTSYNTGTVPGNWTNSWHTYTVRRNTSTFDIWYDGTLVRSSEPTYDPGDPMTLVLNIGSGYGTAAYGQANGLQVGYVRLWTPALGMSGSGTLTAAGTGGGGGLGDTAVASSQVAATAGVASSTTSFSPLAGSMVVVPVTWEFASGAAATLSCKDSLGNVYTSAVQQQNSYNNLIAAAFTYTYATAPGPVTLTVTCTNTTAADALISPHVVTGQGSQSGAATVAVDPAGSSTAISASITTTQAGSLVFLAAGCDYTSTLTPLANTVTVGTYAGDNNGVTGRTAAVTGTPGATTVGWTCTTASTYGYVLVGLEVVAASTTTTTGSAGLSGSGSMSAGTAALPLAINNFDGAANGTAITAGNSAGTGTAFSTVTTVAGATVAFSSTEEIHGGTSGAFATGTTAGLAEVSWTSGVLGNQPVLYGRAYVFLSALPATDDNIIVFYGGSAGFGGGIMIGTSGQLRLQNSAYGETSTGGIMPVGQWFRLEWKIVCGAAGAASATLYYYSGADSTSASSTITDTAGGYGSGGSIDQVNWGWTGGHASQPLIYLDSIGLSATGLFGPVATTFSGTAGLSGSGSMSAAGGISGAAALSGSGSMTAAGAFGGRSALSGSGSLVLATVAVAAPLSGSGSLAAGFTGGAQQSAALIGSGSLAALGVVSGILSESAGLLGYGQFGAVWALGGTAGLSGSGNLAGTGAFAGAVFLSGSGNLAVARSVGWAGLAALFGSGSMHGVPTGTVPESGALSGSGTLGISGERLGYVITFSGIGSLSIPQVSGGLLPGVGGAAVSQALPGSSQVAVAAPGSSNWQWLGTLGQVTALTYSYICPGGCDQMTMTVMVPAAYRTQLFNPGWQVKIIRGGHQVWDGIMDEPVPTASGWNLTAVGTGNLGTNYVSYYSVDDVWPADEPDEIINRAITRGLPWINNGLNTSPYFSQFWMGQATDPGSTTVTAFLNLLCTRGGLIWYVNSQPGGNYVGDDLSVFPLPTVPNRLLVCTTPVARTLGGDINSIFVRYMTVADDSTAGTVAAYSVVEVQNLQSVAVHGELETYIDLSDVGVMSIAQAQAVANSVLAIYQRASFAGPFTVSYGQLLNIAGTPVDPGTDQAGSMCQLILTDFGFGGEVTPNLPITFIVGAYEWDDFAQVATITPYQNVDQSLTGLLSMENTVLTPIAAASS